MVEIKLSEVLLGDDDMLEEFLSKLHQKERKELSSSGYKNKYIEYARGCLKNGDEPYTPIAWLAQYEFFKALRTTNTLAYGKANPFAAIIEVLACEGGGYDYEWTLKYILSKSKDVRKKRSRQLRKEAKARIYDEMNNGKTREGALTLDYSMRDVIYDDDGIEI